MIGALPLPGVNTLEGQCVVGGWPGVLLREHLHAQGLHLIPQVLNLEADALVEEEEREYE